MQNLAKAIGLSRNGFEGSRNVPLASPLAFCLCSAGAAALFAQAPPPAKDSPSAVEAALIELLNTPLNVSSSRGDGFLKTPSTVAVIDRETIRRFNLQTIAEVLDLVAGVDISRTHQMRNVTTVRGVLSDHYSAKVLIMINGVPSWAATTGDGSIVRIDPADVERVEVLRGPASVLYGSNAYSGAVNIVLRQAESSEGESHAAVAEKGGHLGGVRLSQVWGKGKSLLVAVNVNDLEGPARPFADEGVTVGGVKYPPAVRAFQDHQRVKNATLSFQWGSHRVLANFFKTDEGFLGNNPTFPHPEIPPSGFVGDGVGNNQALSGRLVNYTFDWQGPADFRVKTGATCDWNQRDFSRKGDDSHRSDVTGVRTAAFLNASCRLLPSLGLDFGGDYEKRKSMDYTDQLASGQIVWAYALRDRSVAEKSGFLQGRFEKGSFNLLAGTRYTKNDNAGSNVSSRLTSVYVLDERNSLKFIAGQSFRAPTLFELFFQTNGNTIMGNPNLKAEKAMSFELAYLTAIRGCFVQTTVYRATYEDRIMRVTNPANTAQKVYANGGTFHATGLELEAKYSDPERFDAYLNTDLLLGTDKGDINALDPEHYNFKYVPRYHMAAGISFKAGAWFLSLNGRLTGATNGPDNAYQQDSKGAWVQTPSRPLSAQSFVSLSFGYAHALDGGRASHTLSVKNVGDTDLRTPDYMRRVGLDTVPTDGLGRQLSYTLRFTF